MRNLRRPAIKMTHIPTGLESAIFERRLARNRLVDMRAKAKSLLAAKVAKLAEDPLWKEGDGPKVRSWHLHTYLGVPLFVKNERTGESMPFDTEMLNGRIDGLIEANLRKGL